MAVCVMIGSFQSRLICFCSMSAVLHTDILTHIKTTYLKRLWTIAFSQHRRLTHCFGVFAFWLNQSSSCLLQLFHSLNRICLLYCLCCYCNCSTTTSSVALSDQHRHRSWPLLFCVRIKPNPSHIVRHISRYLKCLLHWIFDFWRSVERSVNAIMPICCSISATGAAHKIAASHRGLRVLQLFALVGSTGALNIVVNNWF